MSDQTMLYTRIYASAGICAPSAACHVHALVAVSCLAAEIVAIECIVFTGARHVIDTFGFKNAGILAPQASVRRYATNTIIVRTAWAGFDWGIIVVAKCYGIVDTPLIGEAPRARAIFNASVTFGIPLTWAVLSVGTADYSADLVALATALAPETIRRL